MLRRVGAEACPSTPLRCAQAQGVSGQSAGGHCPCGRPSRPSPAGGGPQTLHRPGRGFPLDGLACTLGPPRPWRPSSSTPCNGGSPYSSRWCRSTKGPNSLPLSNPPDATWASVFSCCRPGLSSSTAMSSEPSGPIPRSSTGSMTATWRWPPSTRPSWNGSASTTPSAPPLAGRPPAGRVP